MELLGTYNIARVDETNYELTYDFPDNCLFSTTYKDGVYVFTIELQAGQSQPSTKFVTEKTTCTAYKGIIDISFSQQDYLALSATYVKKPKIYIDIND